MIRKITPEDLEKAASILSGTLLSEEPKDYYLFDEHSKKDLIQMALEDAAKHNEEVRSLVLLFKAEARILREKSMEQLSFEDIEDLF